MTQKPKSKENQKKKDRNFKNLPFNDVVENILKVKPSKKQNQKKSKTK